MAMDALESDFGIPVTEAMQTHMGAHFPAHYYNIPRAKDAEEPDAMQRRSELVQLMIDLNDAYFNAYQSEYAAKAEAEGVTDKEAKKPPHAVRIIYHEISTRVLNMAMMTASKRVSSPLEFNAKVDEMVQYCRYFDEELQLLANRPDATQVDKDHCNAIRVGIGHMAALADDLKPFRVIDGNADFPSKPTNVYDDRYKAPAFITRLLTEPRESVGTAGENALLKHGAQVKGWSSDPINMQEAVSRTGGAAASRALNDAYGILYCLRQELRAQRVPYQEKEENADKTILENLLEATERVTTQMRAIQGLRDVVSDSYEIYSDRSRPATERCQALYTIVSQNPAVFPTTKKLFTEHGVDQASADHGFGFGLRQVVYPALEKDIKELIEGAQKEGDKIKALLEQEKPFPPAFDKDTIKALVNLSNISLVNARAALKVSVRSPSNVE